MFSILAAAGMDIGQVECTGSFTNTMETPDETTDEVGYPKLFVLDTYQTMVGIEVDIRTRLECKYITDGITGGLKK